MKLYTTILVFMVCCFVTVPMARAEAPLADQLPAGSLLYAGWAGRNLPLDGSSLGQLLQEPAVEHLLGALKTSIDKMPDKNVAHLWAIGGIVWQHPIAFSLIDLAPGADGPKVSAALLIDMGKDKAAFAKHLDALVLNSKVRVSPARVGQITCRTIQSPVGTITLGYKGNIFFLTVGDQTVRKLLSVKPAVSLKSDKAFIARRKDVAGDNEQFAFSIDLTQLRPRISSLFDRAAAGGPKANGGPPAKGEVLKIVDALGLGKITTASGSTRIVDKGLHSKTKIMTPAPHRGVLMLLSGGAVGDADLSGVPDDAIVFCATKFSAAAFYAEVLAMARQIKPGTDKEILKGVARIEDELGISISKEILANLGDSWVLTSASSLGGFGSGTVLTVSVKDAKKLAAAIGRIEAVFRKKTVRVSPPGVRFRPSRAPSIEVLKSGKLEVHYLQTADSNMPIAPAWAIHKNKLYVALWPQVVVAAVENGGKKPLVRDAAFQKLRRHVSGKPVTLTYVDTPAIVRSFYNLLLVGWTVGAHKLSGELGLESYPRIDWLPALPKIEKYLSPEVAAVSSDATGITIESYGSLPIVSNYMTSLLTAAPVGAAFLVPMIQQAQSRAGRAAAAANLKQIGVGVAMYQVDHNQSPPGLVTLVEKGFITAGTLVSPVSGRKMPTDAKGLPTGKSDYVYIVHGRNSAGNMIRAYELPENYGNKGTNVLLVSGAVIWVDMPAFKKLLAESLRQAHK